MSQTAKHRKANAQPATSDSTPLGPFYKILRRDLTHHGFTYQPGLNVDTERFEPEAWSSGGLYFSDLEHIAEYLEYGDLVARVTLPPDARWIQEAPGQFKADRIILNDLQPLENWDLWNDSTFAQHAVQQDPMALMYVKRQTPELCMAAVQNYGRALQFVQHQTPELCLAAVQNYGLALRFVQHQTPELCMAAIQQDSSALRFVKHQTPAICLAAVQQDGVTLRFVKHQTPAICLAAVQQDTRAFRLVKNPSPEFTQDCKNRLLLFWNEE